MSDNDMKNKRKGPVTKQIYMAGHVSFTVADVEEYAAKDEANAAAYQLMLQAMTTSSNITEKAMHRGKVRIEDIYPVTGAETLQMSTLLDEAERVAGNPGDKEFRARLDELRGIVRWSGKRHWNIQWPILLGVIVSVLVLWRLSVVRQDNLNDVQAMCTRVENWISCDTVIPMNRIRPVDSKSRYDNAKLYKQARLYELYQQHAANMEMRNTYLQSKDTAATAESKNLYQKLADDKKLDAGINAKDYNNMNKTGFDGIRAMALDELQVSLDTASSSAGKFRFWNIFFIVLIPFYIVAERPYGYSISRYRVEAKVVGGIRMLAFRLASFLAGDMFAGRKADAKVKEENDTSRKSVPFNILLAILRIILLVVALAVVCVISCLLMLYMTVAGLYRNYDWSTLRSTVKSLFGKK